MALTDLFVFENPGVVAIAIGILVFIAIMTVFKKALDKGTRTLIAIILGAMTSFYLYRKWLYDPGYDQNLMAIVFLVLVAIIILKIFLAFIKSRRR